MKTTLNRESASKVRLTVEATADEVAPSIERAVRALGQQVKIPGFRKGHVPRKVLESRLGVDAVREAALQEAIPALVGKAVEEQELQPIAPPSVEVKTYDLGGALELDATVEVRPEISIPDLSGLAVQRPAAEPTDDEVDQQLARLQERFASLDTVERPAATGDYVLMDIFGTKGDEEVEALSGSDQLYEVGAGFPIEQIDAHLTGAKAGDIFEFDATIPEVMGDLAGTEVHFKLLVKEVRQKSLPDLDDAFATTASEFETLEELRADLLTRIGSVKAMQADAEVRNRILEALLAEVEAEAPESLVNQEMAYRLHRFEDQLQGSGLSIEEYMEANSFTEEQIEADLRTQAERNVRAQLILEEVGKQQGLTVEREEIEAEVNHHAEAMRVSPADVAKQLTDRNRLLALAGDIIRRKALDYIVEQADIKQEDPSDSGSSDMPAIEGD